VSLTQVSFIYFIVQRPNRIAIPAFRLNFANLAENQKLST